MADFRDRFVEATKLQLDGATLESIPLFNSVLLERPDFAPAWCSLAAAIQKLGDSFYALVCYDRAIALAPEEALYYNNRGTAFMDMERFEQANQDFNTAMALNPNIAEIYNHQGNTYMQRRLPAEALRAYKQAAKCKPD